MLSQRTSRGFTPLARRSDLTRFSFIGAHHVASTGLIDQSEPRHEISVFFQPAFMASFFSIARSPRVAFNVTLAEVFGRLCSTHCRSAMEVSDWPSA